MNRIKYLSAQILTGGFDESFGGSIESVDLNIVTAKENPDAGILAVGLNILVT